MSKGTKETKTKKHSDKTFEGQFEDEEVLMVFRKHPIVMRKGLIIASLALLAGPLFTMALTFLRPESPPSMGLFYACLVGSIILSAITFFPYWMSWYFSVFIVTDKRFIQITRKGLFKHKVGDLGVNHIQTINYEVGGFTESLLGFGTIVLQTYIGDLVIHPVPKPYKVQQKISSILEDHGVDLVPPPDQEQQST